MTSLHLGAVMVGPKLADRVRCPSGGRPQTLQLLIHKLQVNLHPMHCIGGCVNQRHQVSLCESSQQSCFYLWTHLETNNLCIVRIGKPPILATKYMFPLGQLTAQLYKKQSQYRKPSSFENLLLKGGVQQAGRSCQLSE